MTINLFYPINSYRLILNFYIIWLPFDRISVNWLLNYLFQFFAACVASIIVNIFFSITAVVLNNSCFYIDCTILQVKQLNELVTDDFNQALRTQRISNQLKIITEAICDILDWNDQVQGLMQLFFLVEFTTVSFIICMCIFIMFSSFSSSVPCLVLMFLFMVRLFTYCWLGSRMVTRVENLTTALYDTDWHLMSPKQRKDLQLIIMVTHNMKAFHGVFRTVDLRTFQKVWCNDFLMTLYNCIFSRFKVLELSYTLLAVLRSRSH